MIVLKDQTQRWLFAFLIKSARSSKASTSTSWKNQREIKERKWIETDIHLGVKASSTPGRVSASIRLNEICKCGSLSINLRLMQTAHSMFILWDSPNSKRDLVSLSNVLIGKSWIEHARWTSTGAALLLLLLRGIIYATFMDRCSCQLARAKENPWMVDSIVSHAKRTREKFCSSHVYIDGPGINIHQCSCVCVRPDVFIHLLKWFSPLSVGDCRGSPFLWNTQ
jgi:hypothetical protein